MTYIAFKRNLSLLGPAGFAYDNLPWTRMGSCISICFSRRSTINCAANCPISKLGGQMVVMVGLEKLANITVIISDYSDIFRYIQACVLNGIDGT